MKKICLLSCLELGDYVQDDDLLVTALEAAGLHVNVQPWESYVDHGEDLFLIRTTWNYTKHLGHFLQRLEPVRERLWNALPVVQWNANKSYLVDLFAKGLPVIPLHIAWDAASLFQALESLGGDDFIVKPLVGAGAEGLIRFHKMEPPPITGNVLVQRFCPEIVRGEVSLVFFSGAFSYALKKTPQPGDIRVQEEFGGEITSYAPTPRELQWAKSVLAEIPDRWLYARVDIVPEVGVIEVECIEPSLYFRTRPDHAPLFAEAIKAL